MAAILISGHYPSIQEQDIPRNPTIKIYLNKAINTSSVKKNNIIVTDYLYNPVAGTVGWDYINAGTPSGIPTILTFTPDSYLDPETTYTVTLPDYPDSVMAVDGSYIQQTYSYRFYTGTATTTNSTPTIIERWEMDLAAAVARQDYAEAARLQALINGTASGTIELPDTATVPSGLILLETYPVHQQSNIPFSELPFFKLSFNDTMPASGIDYNAYINVITKNVLE